MFDEYTISETSAGQTDAEYAGECSANACAAFERMMDERFESDDPGNWRPAKPIEDY